MFESRKEPMPLPAGTVLFDRFELEHVLGRGGFGIAYLARDLVREDAVVVKELAPQGVSRRPDGVLQLGESGNLLRRRFLQEARVLSRFNIRGVLPARAAFTELGTAYFATEYLPNTRTWAKLIEEEDQMSEEGALDIFYQILEVLEAIHARGILHRDIKPTNILVGDRGMVTLIDFGSAREWHADSLHTQTVQFTPGYAPPEQLAERARRGPATDVYSLCASVYHALVGIPPVTATERVAGEDYISLTEARPDIDPTVGHAIDRGLALAYSERPQTVEEMRQLLAANSEIARARSLQELDDLMVRLARFHFNRRACPACDGLLIEVRPLRKGACPVCCESTIRLREINARLCPVCRTGVLHRIENRWPNFICPSCTRSRLRFRKKNLLNPLASAECAECHVVLEGTQENIVVKACPSGAFSAGDSGTSGEWLGRAGRGSAQRECDVCGAEFDEKSDGRWRQIHPKPDAHTHSMYPDEWALLASGFDPGCGNAACDACQADYFLEEDRVTLLGAHSDPNEFATIYQGRLLSLEHVRWLGAGKQSGNPGWVCDTCPTEFDRPQSNRLRSNHIALGRSEESLQLIRTNNAKLARFVDQSFSREDWRRLAQSLPTIDEEQELPQALTQELRTAYRSGRLGFDSANSIIWKGPAVRGDQHAGLTIDNDQISFGGLLRKWRVRRTEIEGVNAVDHQLTLYLARTLEPVVFMIDPVEFSAHLKSGKRGIELTAEDLAERLTTLSDNAT